MAKLRSLADSLDDYVRQIRSIAEIIRSVEDEKSVQASVENTAASRRFDRTRSRVAEHFGRQK